MPIQPHRATARFCIVLFTLGLLSGSCSQVDKALGAIDSAIGELNEANLTFDDLRKLLEGTKQKLDAGVYRDQIDGIIARTGQVAQIGIQGTVDFTRERVRDDLRDIKNALLGRPPISRNPVLANASVTRVDLRDQNRPVVTIIGWNLDVAQRNAQRYYVSIHNAKESPRKAPQPALTYQGQYALTIDCTGGGLPLPDWDQKIVLEGFVPAFELPIVNSEPLVEERLVSLIGHLKTTDQDREGGICRLELKDTTRTLWAHQFPEHPTWGDNHNQPLAFNIDVPMPKSPQFVVVLSQDGARERNILWRFEVRVEARSNKNTLLLFEQNGLSLRCGDENPATVATTVKRLR